MERVRPGKREAHPAITEFNQEDFEMFFRLVRRPETSVWPQPPSQRSPQFPVASCLVKIHSSQVKTGFLRAHGPSDGATSECKRGCGRTMYFKICGLPSACPPVPNHCLGKSLGHNITIRCCQMLAEFDFFIYII